MLHLTPKGKTVIGKCQLPWQAFVILYDKINVIVINITRFSSQLLYGTL
jgi:hypothetical protein